MGAPHTLTLRSYGEGNGGLSDTNASVLILAWEPDHSGQFGQLATEWRTQHAGPVMALCTGGLEQDVTALLAGADQILHPPIQSIDVQARVMAHIRLSYAVRKLQPMTGPQALLAESGAVALNGSSAAEASQTGAPPSEPAVILSAEAASAPIETDGQLPVLLDPKSRRVFVHGNEVVLTPKEYELLAFLLEHPGDALSRDTLLDAVWGINFETGTNMVDVYVHFLRKKLRNAGLARVLETVRGHGYRLNIPKGSPA